MRNTMLVLASGSLAAGAIAQTPGPTIVAVQPDPARVAAATRLLDADDFENQTIRSSELSVGLLLAAMVEGIRKRSGEQVPADLTEQVRKTIHDFTLTKMRAHLPEMKRKAAEIYAQEFTVAELVRLRELHSDPVAVKARERTTQMQPKLMMIGVNTMRADQPELDAKIKQIVLDYLAAHGRPGSQGRSS